MEMIILVAIALCLSTHSVQLRWYMEMCRFSISCVLQHIHTYILYVDMCVCKCTPNLRMGLVKSGRARLTKTQKKRPMNSYLRFCNWCAGWQNVSFFLSHWLFGWRILFHFCAQTYTIHMYSQFDIGEWIASNATRNLLFSQSELVVLVVSQQSHFFVEH